MAVDTLKLYERLVKANIAPEASREIAEAISESSTVSIDGLATKEDMATVKQDLFSVKKDLAKLENKMEQRFAQIDQRFAQIDQRFSQIDQRFAQIDQRFSQLEVTLIKWMIGVGIAGFTAILGLLRLLKVI